MDRLTRALEGKKTYVVDDTWIQHGENGYFGDAVTRLASFENMYDYLMAQQSEISKEMEKLRAEGKNQTVKFKQLFANKLANNNIITLFETYGIK